MQAEVQEFTVRDRLGPLMLRGRVLADCRWGGNPSKARWTDMALYEIVDDESPHRYALEIIARSFVYHRFNSSCVRKKHRLVTVGEIAESEHRWEFLVPCPKRSCNPPDLNQMRDSERVAEELDEPRLYVCTDAKDILRKLYSHSGEISELAEKMLVQASRQDPDIARAWRNTTRRV